MSKNKRKRVIKERKKQRRRHRQHRAKRPGMEVLYEDRDIIVVNKPAGLLSVPIRGSTVQSAFSVVSEYAEQGGGRAYIVHRLDRYTAGVMLFALNQESRDDLVRQFLAHTPKRYYEVIVRGTVAEEQGELRHFLKLVPSGFRQMLSKPGDRDASEAVLRYTVTEQLPGATVLDVQLITGLKNQIRAQFAAIGHPVIGDRQYAGDPAGRELIDHQAMYASSLTVVHPRSGEEVSFDIDPPDDFRRLIATLARQSPGAS